MQPPRVLNLFTQPGAFLAEVAKSGKGYEILILWLLLEYALIAPERLAVHLATFRVDVLGALASLNAGFLSVAIKPTLIVFVVGLAASMSLRRSIVPVNLWGTLSMLAYAWLPHVFLVAASVLVGAAGGDHPLLPHRRVGDLEKGWLVLKLAIEFSPSALLVAMGVRTLRRQEQPPPPAPATGWSWALGAVGVVLLAAAGAVHTARISGEWNRLRPVMPADPVPSFAVRSLDGQRVVREDALQGGVTLIDFWATWCPPCVAAIPHLTELHRELAPRGLKLLSVNVEPDNIEGVRTFAERYQLPFPVYVDSGAMQREFKIHTYPTVVLVDHQGVVRRIYVGSTSIVTIRREIEALLGEAPPRL